MCSRHITEMHFFGRKHTFRIWSSTVVPWPLAQMQCTHILSFNRKVIEFLTITFAKILLEVCATLHQPALESQVK